MALAMKVISQVAQQRKTLEEAVTTALELAHANAEGLFFWRANIVYIARTIIERSADTCLMSSRQPVRVGARLE